MLQAYPSALLEKAVEEFSKLPGIGRKTAVTPGQVHARMEGDTALVVDVTVGGLTLTLRSVILYPATVQPWLVFVVR